MAEYRVIVGGVDCGVVDDATMLTLVQTARDRGDDVVIASVDHFPEADDSRAERPKPLTNAERQAAFRARKRNAKRVTRNAKIDDNPSSVTGESQTDGPFRALSQSDSRQSNETTRENNAPLRNAKRVTRNALDVGKADDLRAAGDATLRALSGLGAFTSSTYDRLPDDEYDAAQARADAELQLADKARRVAEQADDAKTRETALRAARLHDARAEELRPLTDEECERGKHWLGIIRQTLADAKAPTGRPRA